MVLKYPFKWDIFGLYVYLIMYIAFFCVTRNFFKKASEINNSIEKSKSKHRRKKFRIFGIIFLVFCISSFKIIYLRPETLEEN